MMAELEGNPCGYCNVRTMLIHGCCVYEVDPEIGTKIISNGKTRVRVCRNRS